jgi:transposase-like protein
MIHCPCGSTRLCVHPEPGGLIQRYRYHCPDCGRTWTLVQWVVDAIAGGTL